MAFAVPKSLILSVPSSIMSMLAHLRSRWTIFCSWRYFSPLKICATIPAASLSSRCCLSWMYCFRLPFLAYSKTI